MAYIAGLIDGEGCISFADNGNNCIRPLIQVIMTDKDIIEWIALIWGCKVRQFAKHRALPHHKTQYRVLLTGEAASNFCKLLYPYLRVKKRQAKLHIDWLATKNMKPMAQRNQIRQSLKQASHVLNDDRRLHASKGQTVNE